MPSPVDIVAAELTRFLSWYFCGLGVDVER